MADREIVKVHYVKSPAFRTIHADGVIGAPTPAGNIHMALFNERPAIPTEADLAIEGVQLLEIPSSRKGKEGLVRELEVDAIMSLSMAIRLRDWLSTSIDILQKAMGAPPADAGVAAPAQPPNPKEG